MLTAVQLRDGEDLSCVLIHGEPDRTTPGARGPIALFSPGRLVAYLIETPATARCFVFRTLDAPTSTAAEVPGVHPGVSVLIATRSKGRAAHVRNLFLHLTKIGRAPASLSDTFYLRVGNVLAGKLSRRAKLLRSLLEHEEPA